MRDSYFNCYFKGKNEVKVFNSISTSIIKLDLEHYEKLISNVDLLTSEEKEFLKSKCFITDLSPNEEIKKINDIVVEDKNKIGFITIMPNFKCNFRCKYCYEKKNKESLSDELYDKIYQIIQKNIKKISVLNLSWFGGDPSLSIDKVIHFNNKIRRLCKKENVVLLSSMTTNFYLLNKVNFMKLYNCGIKSYQVTIDGEKSVHDSYRVLANGKGTFDIIMSNLVNVKKINGNFNITVRLNYDNKTDYDGYLLDLSNKIGKDKRFNFVFRPISNWDNVNRDYVCSEKGAIRKMCHLIKTSKALGLNCSNYISQLLSSCYVFYPNNLLITEKGLVKQCTVNLDKEDNLLGDLSNYHISKQMFKFDNCPYCRFFPLCKGGSCKYGETDQNLCFEEKRRVITEIVNSI
jgi:uncharacterized protein